MVLILIKTVPKSCGIGREYILASSFFLFFVIICPLSIQPVFADDPSVRITGGSGSNPTRSLYDGINIVLSPGQTTRVTFSYIGIDDDQHINYFECRWDSGTYSRSNCSTPSTERLMMMRGLDGLVTNHWFKTGTASHDFAPGPTPHLFGVRVITVDNTRSQAATWALQVSQSTTLPTPPSSGSPFPVKITKMFDGDDFVFNPYPLLPAVPGNIKVDVDTRTGIRAISKLCYSFGVGQIPSTPSIPSSGPNCDTNRAHFYPYTSYGIFNYLITPGAKYLCIVAYDLSNVRSDPTCLSFVVIDPSNVLVLRPFLDLLAHFAVSDQSPRQLQELSLADRTITPYTNARFTFDGYPAHGEPFDPNKEVFFTCSWDRGVSSPCGLIHSFLVPLCLGGRLCPGPPYTVILLRNFGEETVHGVSQGSHSLLVTSRYVDSSTTDGRNILWCVVDCAANEGNILEANTLSGTIVSGMSGGPNSSITNATNITNKLNESFILPNAGFDKVVNKNTNVLLNGTIYIHLPLNLILNKTITDLKNIDLKKIVPENLTIKSFWKQISGINVKLNSTNGQAVEFTTPDVKNDTVLGFSFTAQDDKGMSHTDPVYITVKSNSIGSQNTPSQQ